MKQDDAIVVLNRARTLRERAKSVQAEVAPAVRAARLQGRSWAEIGTALGVTRQAAQKRYGETE